MVLEWNIRRDNDSVGLRSLCEFVLCLFLQSHQNPCQILVLIYPCSECLIIQIYENNFVFGLGYQFQSNKRIKQGIQNKDFWTRF